MFAFFRSTTIQGLIIILIPFLDQLYQYLSSLPEGTLPEGLRVGLTTLGWFLALYGRVNAAGPLTSRAPHEEV